VDQYESGDAVEINLFNVANDAHPGETNWQPALVLRHDPPGLWVQTPDGRHWFVTNTYRIRPAPPSGSLEQ
jgi:hypothetical protein